MLGFARSTLALFQTIDGKGVMLGLLTILDYKERSTSEKKAALEYVGTSELFLNHASRSQPPYCTCMLAFNVCARLVAQDSHCIVVILWLSH